MTGEIKFALLNNTNASANDIKDLLTLCDLRLDPQIDLFTVAYTDDDTVVACAGLYRNTIRCVAIHPDYRGQNLTHRLFSEIILYAADRGIFRLFLYTKPENIPIFRDCGFYPLVIIPDLVCFMENAPIGIRSYCEKLASDYHPGKVGSIVMNANPFTLGHQYLVEIAAQQCDWLHIFVVSEDISLFSFKDRFQLVKEGTASIPNVSVHSSSEYIVSSATFPSYFLKEKAEIDKAITGIDLLLYRNHIAPALNITYRFVGTEPFSPITNKYNQDMMYWLNKYQTTSLQINVIEIERKQINGTAISATAVRRLLKENNLEGIKKLVPPTTWAFIKENYANYIERHNENH